LCTVLLHLRPGHDWPLLLAGNRDEMIDRPSDPPARHWPDRPDIVAGLDHLGGGTWMGINDFGVVAVILNRSGTLGPLEGKRSRGELPLEALDHADAETAATAMTHLNGIAYRPFNMVIADNTHAFWIKSLGQPRVAVHAIGPGHHMLTSEDLDDPNSPRILDNLDNLKQAPCPDPQTGQWQSWISILTDGKGMNFQLPGGYGTVSSSLLALPSVERPDLKPVWLYTHTPPGDAPFKPLL
jgi:uncharacterized protein with NRDE domain